MSTRKSTRITKARESPGHNMTPGTEKSQIQHRKRQKIAATPRQGGVAISKGKRRAELQYCLTQLPLDILLGIFSLLEPLDLHHLLRVSKAFHDFLWLDTTAHVWHMAYENLPYPHCPPPCPLGVNIIHYTNFLFGIHCQFCASGTGRAAQVKHDTGFVRLCSKCVKKHAIGLRDTADEGVRRLCHTFQIDNYYNSVLKVEYNLRQKEMAQATKEGTLLKYLDQRREAVSYRLHQATGLAVWRNQLIRHANEEKARILAQRRQDIQTRLGREACVPQHLLWQLYAVNLPHVQEEHALTDDEWRYIRADVIECLFDFSETQLTSSIKGPLIARIKALDAVLQQLVATRPRIAPTVLHVASWNLYSQMVKSSVTLDPTVNILKQVAQLPERLIAWRQDTDKYLASLIPKPRRQQKDGLPLELATSFFRCEMCTEPISYPRILMHHCFLRPSGAIVGSNQKTKIPRKKGPREPRPARTITADTIFPSLSETFGEGMYPGRTGVAFHQAASNSARRIILGCGENPDTITYGEMDQKDFRVECLLCTGKGRLVMRWTIAIIHDLNKHGNKTSETHWRLVDSGEDMKEIKKKERKIVEKYDMPAQYCCRLCDEKVKKNYLQHLIDQHQFTKNERNVLQHYYPDIDLTIAVPPLAIRI